jgi:hypothetical protein
MLSTSRARVARAACCPCGGVTGGQAARGTAAQRVFLIVPADIAGGVAQIPAVAEFRVGGAVYEVALRGIDRTRWTRMNPPNYVERSHVLLGRTVDAGRVWDTIAAARYLRTQFGKATPIYLFGEGLAALLAVYAALWEPEIAGVIVKNPPPSHMDAAAPQFLNILRVCDVPEPLGMLAPRPLVVYDAAKTIADRTAAIYAATGATGQFTTPSTAAGTGTVRP